MRIKISACAAALALLLAQGEAQARGPTEWDACFDRAGAYFNVHPLLLKAIARQESSMNPRAVGQNTNGTQDIGMMQINTWHLREGSQLARVGMTRDRLFDPCTNITVGAWVLADAVSRHGMNWKSVGVYHSPTEWRQKDYAAKIQRHLVREVEALRARPAAAVAPAPAAAVTAAPAPSVSVSVQTVAAP